MQSPWPRRGADWWGCGQSARETTERQPRLSGARQVEQRAEGSRERSPERSRSKASRGVPRAKRKGLALH